MPAFLLEVIFWRSAIHAALRVVGLSRQNAYRVMVRAQPVWLQHEQMGKHEAFGLYATKVVMALSDAAARAAAVALVRDAVLAIAANAAGAPPAFEVEESNALRGVAWRQPRGFSLYPAGPQPRHDERDRPVSG